MALSHVVRILVTNYSYTYGTSYDTTSDKGVFFLNGDHFDGIEWVKVEGQQTATSGSCASNSSPSCQVQIRNITDGANVGSEVSMWNESYRYGTTSDYIRRSAATGITSFASGWKAYSPMIKVGCIDSVDFRKVYVLIGVSTTATKWAKYVNGGWFTSKTGTTYGEGDTTYGPNRWAGWSSTAYEGCTEMFHYATMKTNNASYTAYCKGYDVPDLNDIGEVTTTSTDYVGVISASAGTPASDGDEIRTYLKSSNASGTTSILNSVYILPQTGSPTSSREIISMATYGQNADTSTSYAGILNYGIMISSADFPMVTFGDWYYGGCAHKNSKVGGAIHYGTLSDYQTPIGEERDWDTATDELRISTAFSSPLDLSDALFTMHKYVNGAGQQKSDFVQFDQTIDYPAASTSHLLTLLGVGT